MNPSELFLAPQLALLFLLLPLAYALERFAARRRERALRASFAERAPRLAATAPPRRSRAARWAGFGAAALAITAAMQPSFGPPERALLPRGSDIALCLDVSRSMLARDLEPSRLAAAQRAIERLCAAGNADRLALIVFAGEARLRAPLSHDLGALAELAREAHPTDIARGGTDLAAALALARRALESANGEAGAVVVLSDGEDPSGAAAAEARALAERGIAVHALGFGSELGAKIALGAGAEQRFLRDASGRDVVTRLDPRGLQELAASGGGSYATADAEGEALLALHERAIAPRAQERFRERTREHRPQRYALPLLAAILLGILVLARPARLRRIPTR
jgi:Ca-activated chloride channel family protein